MKRILGSLILVVIAMAALPSAAGAVEVETYVGCGVTVSATPADVCTLGDTPGAFFEADEDVEYEVCVEFPSTNFLCAEEQFAEADVLYVNEITTDQLGDHFVWWFVEGVEVGSWSFRINAPPSPSIPPAVVPAPPAPPALPAVAPSAACINAKARVRSLGKQLSKASDPKRKANLRSRLRRARAAKKRLC